MPEGEANEGKQKTPQAGGKEGENEENLELMNKTPLKEKGKKGESKKKKKKGETVEEKGNRAKSKKKATFAKTQEGSHSSAAHRVQEVHCWFCHQG
jgi:hypothetical protein